MARYVTLFDEISERCLQQQQQERELPRDADGPPNRATPVRPTFAGKIDRWKAVVPEGQTGPLVRDLIERELKRRERTERLKGE